jgi:hypothetical protein
MLLTEGLLLPCGESCWFQTEVKLVRYSGTLRWQTSAIGNQVWEKCCVCRPTRTWDNELPNSSFDRQEHHLAAPLWLSKLVETRVQVRVRLVKVNIPCSVACCLGSNCSILAFV